MGYGGLQFTVPLTHAFTRTLSTRPLKAFELKMPALCFILTHNNHILHMAGRMLMICGGKPTQATNVPMKTLAIWKTIDHKIQQVAQMLHSWLSTVFLPWPAACQSWCFLLSTGGSGPSLLLKPKMPMLPLGLGIVGPGDVICVCSSLSDFIVPPLGCLPVQYLHSKGTHPCGSCYVFT